MDLKSTRPIRERLIFKRILVPLDESTSADALLPLAARLAQAVPGTLLLVQVVPPPSTAVPAGGVATAPSTQGEAVARAFLEQVAHQHAPASLQTEIHVLVGSPAPAILAALSTYQADLVVIGRRRPYRSRPWRLGSTAQQVVRQATIPALVVPVEKRSRLTALASEQYPAVRTLVPLDGSRLAEMTLAPAAQLTALLAGSAVGAVHLVRVVPDVAERHAAAAYLRVVAHRLRQSALAPLIPRISWSVVVHLDVAEALLWVATQGEDAAYRVSWSIVREVAEPFAGCDLLALATHGHTGLKRWTLGSVAERVLQAAHLPVLVVHPSEQTLSLEPTAADITQEEIHRWLGLDEDTLFSTKASHLPGSWNLER